MSQVTAVAKAINENVSKVIFGKELQIDLVLAAWFTGGHVLLEDVPGTGKTMLAKALSKSVSVPFSRLQFTPDLLPSDVTGTTIYDKANDKFTFLKGPVFTTFFLCDEINRASPRTQSALLECMAEKQITIEGKTVYLPSLFFVMATQNPVEQQGTFPLPEAQLDRFAIKLALGYPDEKQELEIIKNKILGESIDDIEAICPADDIKTIKEEIKKVRIPHQVFDYIYSIVEATRKHQGLILGGSPRASITLAKMGQAMALINGDSYVKPSTIYKLAPYVLNHRIVLSAEARFDELTTDTIMRQILSSIKTPTE